MLKRKSWFKLKRYPHIGLPVYCHQRPKVEKYVHNEAKVAEYAFFPLIRREQRSYRYRLCDDGKRRKRVKIRKISYATHFDSLIYSYYAHRLSKLYEKYLISNGLSENVIAYRSIAKGDFSSKCNIDFAKDAFDYISSAVRHSPQSVVVTDISSFFDNINHRLLKEAWKFLCHEPSLNSAEYNIFKSVTRYSYVNDSDLFELFKDRLICSKDDCGYKIRKVKKIKFFRDKDVVAFCRKEDIGIIRSKGLIKTNKVFKDGERVGIPQGLPISAVLANMYMYSFDLALLLFTKQVGGFYRRYSDDIMLVYPSDQLQNGIQTLKNEIKKVKLDISDDKTKVFNVAVNEDSSVSVTCNEKPAVIEYLGFAFDGNNVRIKNKGICQYYLKMTKAIRRKVGYSLHKSDDTYGFLFENQLLKKFTPIGSRRHKILQRDPKTKKCDYSGNKSFGNFWTYVTKSADIFHSESIRGQLRHNKPILRSRVLKAKREIQLSISKRQWREYFRSGRIFSLVKDKIKVLIDRALFIKS